MGGITKFKSLLLRNIKIYFADKTVFLVSLMAPTILLLLFVLFLRGVYVNSLTSMLPQGFEFAAGDIKGSFVASWIVSAIMSVTCVTVSMGACIIMVQDKITGVINDLKAAPIKNGTVMFAYFAATFVSALIIMLLILGLGLIYIAFSGWYLTFSDIMLILLNTVLTTLFGCGVAIILNSFIKSDGGLTAVSALTASVYGFICGAYMPLSQFGKAFSNIFGFNPGLYGAILFKNLFLRGTVGQMQNEIPTQAVNALKDGFDMNFYFFGNEVSVTAMWLILALAVVATGLIAVLISNRHKLGRKRLKIKKN